MFIIILSFVFSLANAIEGQFSYQGEHTVHGAIRYETVYPSTEAGKLRIAELQADDYQCQSKLQFIQCHKFYEDNIIIPGIIQNNPPSVLNVEFGKMISKNLVSQGDDVSFYEADQPVTVDGKKYNLVKYMETSDLIKATVGNPNISSDYHSFVVYTDSVAVFDTITVTESKWVYTKYLVEFNLTH